MSEADVDDNGRARPTGSSVDMPPPSAVRVHLCLDEAGPDVVTACRGVLSTDELARADRFVFAPDRVRYTLAHALVRHVLSRHAPLPPQAWRFFENDHGCPFVLDPPAGAPGLHFNLSHTRGLIAVGVVTGRDLGVDVEFVDRGLTQDVAGRFFAPDEVRDLRGLPEDQQPVAFFDYWTLKEAYIKARGLGLALPLDQFAFALRADRAPTIAFGPQIADDPSRWQFFQAWPLPRHRMGVAVERRGADLPIELVWETPGALPA
jgi:4'-phosphopantetheinyl transferase